MDETYDVFISYSQDDSAAAELAHEALERRGFRVFRDVILKTSADLSDDIVEAIGASRRVAFLWSRSAVGKTWVKSEAMLTPEEKRSHFRIDAIDVRQIPPPYCTGVVRPLADARGRVTADSLKTLVDDMVEHLGEPKAATPGGAHGPSPADDIEDALVAMMDRTNHLGTVEPKWHPEAIAKRDRCLVYFCCTGYDEYSRMLRKLLQYRYPDWHDCVGKERLQPLPVALSAANPRTFEHGLQNKLPPVAREDDAAAERLRAWVDSGDGLRVVHGSFNLLGDTRGVIRAVQEAGRFVSDVARFAPSRMLLVAVALLHDPEENLGFMRRDKLRRARRTFDRTLVPRGWLPLPPLPPLRQLDVQPWTDTFPERLRSHYRMADVRARASRAFARDTERRFLHAASDLKDALRSGRRDDAYKDGAFR